MTFKTLQITGEIFTNNIQNFTKNRGKVDK